MAAIAVAISSSGRGDGRPSAAAAPVDTAGLAPKFIANAKHGNRVVDGSIAAKLTALKGVPVVVNQWASWCPNCKAEFGYFARVAKTYRGRVAFVGLDSQDSRGNAEDFLTDRPVSYPSIFDQRESGGVGRRRRELADNDLLQRQGRTDRYPARWVYDGRVARRRHPAVRAASRRVTDPASGVGMIAAVFAGAISLLSPCVLPLVPGFSRP